MILSKIFIDFSISSLNNTGYLTSNSFFNTSNSFEYKNTAASTLLVIGTSGFQFNIAPSGTAGTNITYTQAMTLDASGNLGVGTTSPTFGGTRGIHIANSSGDSRLHLTDNTTGATANDGTEIVVNSGNLYIDQKEAQPILILVSSLEVARFPAAGGFQSKTTISVGDAAPSTSGAGITFPATQSASSNANTLDDYEEGTWTPTYTSNGTASTFSYGLQIGYYTKIGNRVLCTMRLYTNTTGNTLGTGDVSISGLPFAGQAGDQTTMISIHNLNGNWVTTAPSLANIPASTAAASLFGYTALNTNPVAITTTNMSATDVNQTWSTFQYLVA